LSFFNIGKLFLEKAIFPVYDLDMGARGAVLLSEIVCGAAEV
jgi:hypothetical protein